MPGSCICNEGYAGQNCDRCDLGYHSYPNCEPCTCSIAGTVDPNQCEGRCVCKVNMLVIFLENLLTLYQTTKF